MLAGANANIEVEGVKSTGSAAIFSSLSSKSED